MTQEDYVSFEQAIKLKEHGFDWITYCAYDKIYTDDRPWELRNYHTPQNHNIAQYSASAPTLSQAQKWLRENYSLHIQVGTTYYRQYKVFDVDLFDLNNHHIVHRNCQGFETFEDALKEGINLAFLEIESRKRASEILKENKNESVNQ